MNTEPTTKKPATPPLPAPDGSAFLPLLHDMLAMGVPEVTALRWHDAVWLLKSHAEHMAEVIEEQTCDKTVLREAAENFRDAMCAIRPNNKRSGGGTTEQQQQTERTPRRPLTERKP
jgi:hypothetical protein